MSVVSKSFCPHFFCQAFARAVCKSIFKDKPFHMALYFCLQDKILCVAIVDTIGKAGAEGNQKTWYVPCLASGLLPFFTIFWASSNASWWQKHQKGEKGQSRDERRQDCWPFFLWSHLFWSICHLVSQGSCVPSIWDSSPCMMKWVVHPFLSLLEKLHSLKIGLFQRLWKLITEGKNVIYLPSDRPSF